MKKLNLVGVDVSANTFTLIHDHEGTRTEGNDLPNDPKGHKKLIRMATRKALALVSYRKRRATIAST